MLPTALNIILYYIILYYIILYYITLFIFCLIFYLVCNYLVCNKIFFHHKSTHRSPQRSLQATIYLYTLYTCKKTHHIYFFPIFFSRPKVITNDCRYPFRPPFKLSTLYTCINTPHYTSQPFCHLKDIFLIRKTITDVPTGPPLALYTCIDHSL